MKVMARCSSGGLLLHHVLLQHVVVGVFMPRPTESVGWSGGSSNHERLETVKNRSMQALHIGMNGNVLPLGRDKNWVQDPAVVRREVTSQSGQVDVVLLEMQESSGSVKIVIVCLASLGSLIAFCSLAVWLVWKPMSAIFEERAYEQAAKQALLDAAPTAPPAVPPDGSEPLMSSEEHNAANRERREEQLTLAWKKFLDNPILQIKRSNLLARILHQLLEAESFADQLEDLFNSIIEEGSDVLKKEDLEKVVEGVSGKLHNMHVKGSISEVEFKQDIECSLAVASVAEDYGWLFDSYDTVFPQSLPFDKTCFGGVVSLVIVWNYVRTLHTARHMNQEHVKANNAQMINKIALDVKIDPRI
jgi:hypothetical protein